MDNWERHHPAGQIHSERKAWIKKSLVWVDTASDQQLHFSGEKSNCRESSNEMNFNRLKYCGSGSLLLVGVSKGLKLCYWCCTAGGHLQLKTAALLEILKVDLSVNQVRWCVCHSRPGYLESPCNGWTFPQGNERLFMCRYLCISCCSVHDVNMTCNW